MKGTPQVKHGINTLFQSYPKSSTIRLVMINHIKEKKINLGWILKSPCLTSFNPEVDMRGQTGKRDQIVLKLIGMNRLIWVMSWLMTLWNSG